MTLGEFILLVLIVILSTTIFSFSGGYDCCDNPYSAQGTTDDSRCVDVMIISLNTVQIIITL